MKYLVIGFLFILGENLFSQDQIIPGAWLTYQYLPLLKGEKTGLVANPTSNIKDLHLVDSLIKLGVEINCIFSPEHGFRGNADAGEKLQNDIDPKTGIRVISLYGENIKPLVSDLKGLQVIIFDIQDVGVRFYTYISSLHYVMEACAENKIPLIVLDRPNPNGFFIDGPLLDPLLKSFVGMHPVPLVHGMTIGEFALMINGEGWLKENKKCELTVIPCKNYTHKSTYPLPVKPSPNLPDMQAIYLYPSLGLFEGTVMSVGRGTVKPFRWIGHPKFPDHSFSFIPKSIPGAAKKPLYENEICYGLDLSSIPADSLIKKNKINLTYIIECYKQMNFGESFFNSLFDKLAGTTGLRKQIISGMPEKEIRLSWQKDLESFKIIRKKYLLYPDFE